jgi:hypothetical protein
LGRVRRGQPAVDLRAQVAAGLGPEPARMQAHLLAQAGDAKARQLAGDTNRIHGAQQLQRPVLGALGAGDARHRAEAEKHGFGEGAAFQHIESVREQVTGTGSLRSQVAAARSAAITQANGLRRPRSTSARASVGCSSFSASTAWPSHRNDSPTMKSPQRPR